MELVLPMYNSHPYFFPPKFGQKVRLIQGKIRHLCLPCFAKIFAQHPKTLWIKSTNYNERGGAMSEWRANDPSGDHFPVLQDSHTSADFVLPFISEKSA